MPCTPGARASLRRTQAFHAAERRIEPLGDFAVRAAVNIGEQDAVALRVSSRSQAFVQAAEIGIDSKRFGHRRGVGDRFGLLMASIVSSSAETSRPLVRTADSA